MSGRVLITGGFGYVGSALAQRFLADGYVVILLTSRAGNSLQGCETVHADVRDVDALRAAVAQARPDIVLHMVAVNETVRDTRLSFDVTAFGTKNILDACADVEKFIYFSTFHVYGCTGKITEKTPPVPLHDYGITHLVAELFCRAARKDKHLVIARMSNAVGAPSHKDVDRWSLLLLDLCKQAHERKELRLLSSGAQLRDFVTLDDVYAATKILFASREDPVFNLGSGQSMGRDGTARISIALR
jgi:UDP-glucose 4-epimerase